MTSPEALFALHHTNDPETSREAVARHADTGRLSQHRRIVFDLVLRCPGSPACELWESATLPERESLVDMQEVSRRLTDLCRERLLEQAERRGCRIKGSKMVTWKAVGLQS